MNLFYGNNLKIYRKQNKLKQVDLIKELDISQAMLRYA